MANLSIITVVYNCLEGFKKTADSISSQSYSDLEWIVVDGGSTDGTKDYIISHSHLITRWISEPDNGIFDAMNKGIKLATGAWVTFMNADDTYTSTSTLATIFNHKSLTHHDFIYSDMILIGANNQRVRPIKAERLTRLSISKGMIACHQGMFVKRSICPSYSTHLTYQGDLDWTISILKSIPQSHILYIPIHTVFYKSDGFSNHHIYHQLQAHIKLILCHYGFWMLIIRIPRLVRRYLGKVLRKWLNIETFRFWVYKR